MIVKIIERPKGNSTDIVELHECKQVRFPIFSKQNIDGVIVETREVKIVDNDLDATFYSIDERSSIYVLNDNGQTIEHLQ